MDFRKYVFFEGFRRNGLQIRIQREKLRISAPDEILRFLEKSWIFQFITSKLIEMKIFSLWGC